MDDEYEESDLPPAWRFKPISLVAELSKIPMGIAYACVVLAQTFYSVFEGIHRDLTAHYNYQHAKDSFAAEVAYDLETLDTTEE